MITDREGRRTGRGGRRSSSRGPARWLIWHPHQKLWNWRLVWLIRGVVRPAPLASRAVRLLVEVDSMLLLGRAALRRLRLLGATVLPPLPAGTTVLYVDCGVHVEGSELVWLSRWLSKRCDLRILAFEAGRSHYERAARNLAGIPGLDLRHAALVGPGHDAATATLHLGDDDGRGASLFAVRGTTAEEVPAARLSSVLRDEIPTSAVVILRMNIEGAEWMVIEDLLEASMASRIDGYYGMWDDLSKLDPSLDADFRRVLKTHRIRTFPFNDRDLRHRTRRVAIRVDIETAIHAARR